MADTFSRLIEFRSMILYWILTSTLRIEICCSCSDFFCVCWVPQVLRAFSAETWVDGLPRVSSDSRRRLRLSNVAKWKSQSLKVCASHKSEQQKRSELILLPSRSSAQRSIMQPRRKRATKEQNYVYQPGSSNLNYSGSTHQITMRFSKNTI